MNERKSVSENILEYNTTCTTFAFTQLAAQQGRGEGEGKGGTGRRGEGE